MRLCTRNSVLSLVLCSFLIAPAASAVGIGYAPVFDAGNACDTQTQGCFGSVGYDYHIDVIEVTNAQYAEFLNAKAATDTYNLYNVSMGVSGGISRSGTPGSFVYTPIAARAQRPVNLVSFYDALRFANWMNNGQGTGDTETGAYTLLGGLPTPTNGLTVTRNPGASIFLTSEDEWYKAAYYDALSTSYFDYPAGSNTTTTCAAPTATANRANCGNAVGTLVPNSSYPGSPSPYGTFDQGGNVAEWNEAIEPVAGLGRGFRGGNYAQGVINLSGGSQHFGGPDIEVLTIGFRIATIVPEPGTGLLLAIGLLGIGLRRRRS